MNPQPFAARSERGITIMELMVVVAIMALLLGAAMALMKQVGRTSELTASGLEIKSLFNRARATALAQKTRVELGIEMFERGGRVYSHLRRTITHLHFEETPDDGGDFVTGTGGHQAEVHQADFVAIGRTGQGIEFRGGEQSMLQMRTTTAFDCPEGVYLEADILLSDVVGPAMIIGRGESYYLGIDEQGRLMGGGHFDGTIFVPPLPGTAEIRSKSGEIRVHALDETIPRRRWVHVEMVMDRRGIRLYMDNVPLITFIEDLEDEDAVRKILDDAAQAAANGEELGGGGGEVEFTGMSDKIARARMAAEAGFLPETYDPNTHLVWLYFTSEGRLDPQFHTRPTEFYLERAAKIDQPIPPPATAANFRIQPTTEPLIIGANVLGRMDNVRISSLESGDTIQLPRGLELVPVPDAMENRERRKITVELMGTVR